MLKYKAIPQWEAVVPRYPWVTMGILLAAVLLAFWPTLGNLLQEGWDDQWQVTNPYTSGGFTWVNLRKIFTEPYFTQYSPLNQCMYTLLYYIDGYNPSLFHAASLCLHAINVLLVFRLLAVLLRDTTFLPLVQINWITFLTALLFAVHPLQVESVAWMSASKILLYSFFYLLATWAFMRFLKGDERRGIRAWRWYALAVLLFLCAYGCKEQAVIFPVWATLLCVFYHKRLKVDRRLCISLLLLYGLAVVLGLLFIFGISQRSDLRDGEFLLEFPLWQRLVFSCYALIEYVFKWFFPYRLTHLYVFPMAVGDPLPSWFLAYPPLLTVLLLISLLSLHRGAIASGICFFLINIIFVLHLFPICRPNLVADRYVYMAAVGASFLIAYSFVRVYVQWRSRQKRYMAVVGAIFSVFTLILYSNVRVRCWYDTPTLKGELEVLVVKDRDCLKNDF